MNTQLNTFHTHAVYAVFFSDGRIKVGLTANTMKRMQYYAQEARRNRVQSLTWWASSPTHERFARCIERHFCREMRPCAIPGHREWFVGDAPAFQSVISALERLREQFAVDEESAAELPFLGSCGHAQTCGGQ